MSDGLSVTALEDGFWRITDPGYARPSHSYLIEGRERAALVDSGLGLLDLRAVVEGLTDRDIVVIQTHAHPDHAGGSHRFERVVCHPLAVDKLRVGWSNMELRFTLESYYKERDLPAGIDAQTFAIPPCGEVAALENRGVVDLGERQLDVFFTPGHARDSICLLELEHGWLFTGDTILKGQIAVEDSPAYRRTLIELVKLAQLAQALYPGHGDVPVDPEFVPRVRSGFTEALGDRHPSGFLAGFATFQFEDFGIMLPPRRRRLQEE